MTWNLFCDHSKRREDWERSIFVRLKEGGYRLRENILFHLYVSTSPCGDARLNSPYEITTDRKKKNLPSPLCAFCLFFGLPVLFCFGFFDASCSLSLLAESVSLESKNTAGFRECVCVSVQLMLCPVCWGKVCRENQSWARQLCTPGASGEYIHAFPAWYVQP